jgi:ABC-type multidrug transport system ATPase subunit
VRAAGIVKEFGFRRVLDGLSLEIAAGTFLSLLGPNGAGKTTLLRILATLARPTEGRVEIQGLDVRGPHQIAIRARIGVISHQTFLYDGLTARENLLFFARQYGIPAASGRAEALLREFGLWERRDDRAGSFSRGMQQRLTIARASCTIPRSCSSTSRSPVSTPRRRACCAACSSACARTDGRSS